MKNKIIKNLAKAAMLYNFSLLQYLIWVPDLQVDKWPLNAFIDEGFLLLILTPILIGLIED